MSDEERTVDPRTGLAVLDSERCWELLRSTQIGRLAVAVGHYPDIFPVNYRIWRDKVVIRTEAGTKLAGAVLNGSVAFEIDEIDPEHHSGWSVVVSGRGREPERMEEELALEDLDFELWVGTPKSRWLIIEPETVTGRELPPRDG
ncbi:MAG: pyridoxamine 5'-phosphate oxidase family protein [Acidimicrobiia bacterium]|nr:pyridoxamine 5'-phosphate oxidase family protein [Acidimicrobiia bacterium]